MIQKIVNRIINMYLNLKYAEENKIFTHLSVNEKIKLIQLANNVNGNIFLEVGSYLGASSCFIAAGIKKPGKEAKLYCIDTWENDAMTEGKKETFQIFIENTKKYQDIIIPLRGISVEVAKTFKDIIDFLFIDGDHSYEGVKADVDAWFPKLNKNAIVIFHDIGWAEGVQRVIAKEVAPRAKKEGRLPNLYWASL
jgi:predicted O-methyltransferase YrrM